MPDGTFANLGLTAAELTTMRTEWLACLSAVAANQNYSMNGRSFTRADLAQVRATIAEIGYALSLTNGDIVRNVFVDMRNP